MLLKNDKKQTFFSFYLVVFLAEFYQSVTVDGRKRADERETCLCSKPLPSVFICLTYFCRYYLFSHPIFPVFAVPVTHCMIVYSLFIEMNNRVFSIKCVYSFIEKLQN